MIGGQRLCQRGLAPKLADSEVITMEVVGEFLGLETDVGLWKYFNHHGRSWFPALGSRTAFAQKVEHRVYPETKKPCKLECLQGEINRVEPG